MERKIENVGVTTGHILHAERIKGRCDHWTWKEGKRSEATEH